AAVGALQRLRHLVVRPQGAPGVLREDQGGRRRVGQLQRDGQQRRGGLGGGDVVEDEHADVLVVVGQPLGQRRVHRAAVAELLPGEFAGDPHQGLLDHRVFRNSTSSNRSVSVSVVPYSCPELELPGLETSKVKRGFSTSVV